MKIFYIWAFKIYGGNSAGASRIMNFARALALSENQVYLCSFLTPQKMDIINAREIDKNIFILGKESLVKKYILLYKIIRPIRTLIFILNLYKILDKKDKEIRIIFYPSIYVSLDLWVVIFLIKLGGFKIFLEVNEVRKFYVYDKILAEIFCEIFINKNSSIYKIIEV